MTARNRGVTRASDTEPLKSKCPKGTPPTVPLVFAPKQAEAPPLQISLWGPDNTAFCFSLSLTEKSKLRTRQPMRVCAWVSRRRDKLYFSMVLKTTGLFGHHILLHARYDTSSTANVDGDQDDK